MTVVYTLIYISLAIGFTGAWVAIGTSKKLQDLAARVALLEPTEQPVDRRAPRD